MYLILISIIAVLVLAFAAGCSRSNEASTTQAIAVPVAPATKSDKDQIRKKLRRLAEAPPPKELSAGAMCYKMAGPPKRVEYVCVTCGERTLYTLPEDHWDPTVWFIHREISNCRRLIQQIKGIDVILNESEFCRRCTPESKKRELILEINYLGEKPHVIRGINSDDLTLLVEFSNGEITHKTSNDGKYPLKNSIPRLEKLLGVSLDD